MQASERDRSVLALLTGNGAVSVHPDRIETSDRDTFHIGAWAAEIRAGTAVAVGAGVGNAASVACTFGLQRDCGADGVDAFVERLRAGAESLYRLDVRAGMEADAFLAAFTLPDMISYFLVGGAASITFVTILTRYRDSGREAEGERSLSVILTSMFVVLGAAIVLAEIFAPWYVHWWFNGFDAKKAALCIKLTRILLPAQLFFFAGGVFGAVLLVRKQFNVQAVAPLIYNLGTIVGGILLVRRLGISSLAIGTVAGALVGPFLLNAIFARRAGVRYRPILDWHDEGLREWVRLSLPLMIGVSLVTAITGSLAHFASGTSGAISLMTYAKRLFTAPMSVLAQAAGAASMPFFASLWATEKRTEFATAVADSVSRVACMGLLVASAMVVLGEPLIDVVFVGGRFSRADAAECAAYFAVFSVSLFLWSAQSIYSRHSTQRGILLRRWRRGQLLR